MRRAEKALRDAGWEEVPRNEAQVGDEVYDLEEHEVFVVDAASSLACNWKVLRAPRPEPEYEPGTVALIQPYESEGAEVAMRTGSGGWWVPSDRYIPSEVEVLRIIAYPDGTVPPIRQIGTGFTRIEVIDDTGRAYVNTAARDVEVALQDDGRTLKVSTGGTGVTPRPPLHRPGDSFGQCVPDVDAVNERLDARARELLGRLWEKLDEKDDTK